MRDSSPSTRSPLSGSISTSTLLVASGSDAETVSTTPASCTVAASEPRVEIGEVGEGVVRKLNAHTRF